LALSIEQQAQAEGILLHKVIAEAVALNYTILDAFTLHKS
jgi:hypothetical protein